MYDWLLLLWPSARGDEAVLVRLVVQKQEWEGRCRRRRRRRRRHLHCASCYGIRGRLRASEQLNVIVVVDFRQFRILTVREELRHEVVEQAVPLVDDLAEEVLRGEK